MEPSWVPPHKMDWRIKLAWYIARTLPAQVPLLVLQLTQSGGEAYYPKLPAVRRAGNTRRRILTHELPAFPGYFFVRVESLPLLRPEGLAMVRLLRWSRAEDPAVFGDELIEQVRLDELSWGDQLVSGVEPVRVKVGQKVKFNSGIFTGKVGVVLSVSGNLSEVSVSGLTIRTNTLLLDLEKGKVQNA